MGIDLATILTRHPPAGEMHGVNRKTEIEPLEPSYEARPYASLTDGVTHAGEDGVELATRHRTAGVTSRARAGQILSDSNAYGTRVSPINLPEAIRGRMVAMSI